MKILLYAIVLSLVFAGVAAATSDCSSFDGAGETTNGVNCILEPLCKIYNVDGKCVRFEGETITINCSRRLEVGNNKTSVPLSGIKVTIKGYDFDNIPTSFVWTGALSKKGTLDFVPSHAGRYLIEAMLPSADTTNSINSGSEELWNPVIDVIENPNKVDDIITAAVVAPPVEEPAEPVENTSEATEPADPLGAFAPKCHTDMSMFDFVMNVTETDKVRSDAPAIALMLVGFLMG